MKALLCWTKGTTTIQASPSDNAAGPVIPSENRICVSTYITAGNVADIGSQFLSSMHDQVFLLDNIHNKHIPRC